MKRCWASLILLAVSIAASAQQIPPTPVAAPVLPPSSADQTVSPSELRSKPRFIRGTPIDDLPEFAVFTKAGRFGQVAAKATITPEGRLRDIVMSPSTGDPTVDAAIVRTLESWVLTSPIDKNGAKVSTNGYFPVAIGSFPKRLAGTDPQMPQAAKDAFHNGKVTVSYAIDPTGTPIDAKITRSSKSELLDQAVLSAIAMGRFEKPIGLDGKPSAVPVTLTYRLSQMDGEGSYIGSLKNLSCRIVAGEVDWWTAANPDAKPSDLEFYSFMAGLVIIMPDALGWGKVDFLQANARHKQAWANALSVCRTKPEMKFLEAYRKG